MLNVVVITVLSVFRQFGVWPCVQGNREESGAAVEAGAAMVQTRTQTDVFGIRPPLGHHDLPVCPHVRLTARLKDPKHQFSGYPSETKITVVQAQMPKGNRPIPSDPMPLSVHD